MAELSHFDLDGDLLEIVDEAARKNVDALQKEQEELKELCDSEKILSNAITETTSTTQPNSYAGRENILEIGGLTEQDSTAGNQLLNYSGLSETTSNGITFTPIYDRNGNLEYINIKGTATANSIYAIGADRIHIQSGESYILSGAPSSASGTTCRMYLYNCDGNGKFIYDNGVGTEFVFSNESTNYNVAIIVYNGYTANNLKFYPMLRKASVTDATYEPYTGGIPAPNPSYPMEIKKSVVSGVKTHWKNLLKNEWEFGSPSSGGNVTRARCKTLIPIKQGVSYVFSSNDSTNYKYALNTSKEGSYPFNSSELGVLGNGATWNNGNESFTALDNGFLSVCISKKDDSTFALEDITNLEIQFEEGTVATPYERYTESSYTFSQPIELYGIGDVQDVITPKPIKRRCFVKVFDGTETLAKWTPTLGGVHFGYANTNIKHKVSDTEFSGGVCNYLKEIDGTTMWNTSEIGFSISTSGTQFRFRLDNTMTTVEEAQAWLAEKYAEGNPFTIVVPLAEETTESLPIADQIGLNSLATYDGITYVEFDAEIQPTFKAEYGTSKVGGVATEALGKANTSVAHPNDKSNPHNVTKEQLGLGNVDNTSDANKPVSTAQKEYVDAHTGKKDNPHGVTKEQIGLDKVENKTSAEILGELTKEDIDALKVLAAAVRSLNADGSMMCSISDGLAKFFKGDTVQGAIGVNQVTTNGQTYTTFNIRGYEDLMAFSFEGNSNARYYMNPKNIPLTDAQYTEPHHFKGDMRVVGDVKATGGMWSNEFNINKLGLSGGAAQPVEWVWHGELQRWVLCTITE